MPKFRKRSVVVEAWRNGDDTGPVPEWVEAASVRLAGGRFAIETMEGMMIAEMGDWIIRGTAGEVYPCKPKIFAAIYEPVE